ncbi:MAG: 50S ribosomal protein L6 [Candidatus Omnitrophica bacterium]|nr:50S ribosomal protein L6 [Candidatus Omnitrophota bacterium]
MSRVGKIPVNIPSGVKAEVKGNIIYIEGPKGKLEHRFPERFKITIKDNRIAVERPSSSKEDLSLCGLTRTIVFNLIKGVTEGYKKELEIKGVGFKAQAQGNTLQITLGFSHPVKYAIPEGISVSTPKPIQIVVAGTDKVKVGAVAAQIRDFFKPEPYTGKGIRYVGEYVRHKAGKTVAK